MSVRVYKCGDVHELNRGMALLSQVLYPSAPMWEAVV